MEFNEKLQELRKHRGLTQEELAEKLFVSRTAVSKWESGRGYPSIDSLRAIAKFFSVTVDELISTDEILVVAEADNKQKENRFGDLIYSLLDLSLALLLFLPFFAEKTAEGVLSLPLLRICLIQPYLRIAYFAVVIGTSLFGVLTLVLQGYQSTAWVRSKRVLSLALGTLAVLLFTVSSQPYAAIFVFTLLAIKALSLIKWR